VYAAAVGACRYALCTYFLPHLLCTLMRSRKQMPLLSHGKFAPQCCVRDQSASASVCRGRSLIVTSSETYVLTELSSNRAPFPTHMHQSPMHMYYHLLTTGIMCLRHCYCSASLLHRSCQNCTEIAKSVGTSLDLQKPGVQTTHPGVCQVLHVGRSVPVLSQLRSFLKAAYPVEYAERDAEERSSAATNNSSEPSLPLFVMASMLPGIFTMTALT
jgi:hypothetical protein